MRVWQRIARALLAVCLGLVPCRAPSVAEAHGRRGTDQLRADDDRVTPRRLSVLHVILDDFQLHAELSGASPRLDAFARTATNFARAYCQSPICTASRSSFLTGRRPDRIGINGDFRENEAAAAAAAVSERWTTLPGYFKRSGYAVLGLGKTFHPGKPAAWDGAASWSDPSAAADDPGPSSSPSSSRHWQQPPLGTGDNDDTAAASIAALMRAGDAEARALGHAAWPLAGEYEAATTARGRTAQCAGGTLGNRANGSQGAGGKSAGGSQGHARASAPPPPGSRGKPACWCRDGGKSGGDGGEDGGYGTEGGSGEGGSPYDEELGDRAVELLGRIAARRTAVPSSASVPFYLAVGFHLPHTPWIVPRTFWEAFAGSPTEAAAATSAADAPAASTGGSGGARLGPAPPAPQQTLPRGAPDLAGCAGLGCLGDAWYVAPNGSLAAVASPRDFGPWRAMPVSAAAHLRGAYRAAVAFADAQVGRLLDALDAGGLASSTVRRKGPEG